jgi:hypothetical protein
LESGTLQKTVHQIDPKNGRFQAIGMGGVALQNTSVAVAELCLRHYVLSLAAKSAQSTGDNATFWLLLCATLLVVSERASSATATTVF